MTILLYVRRKGWPVNAITVEGTHQREHAKDFEDVEASDSAYIDVIDRNILVDGDLTPEQLDRIAYIATRCPVHRTLESKPVIRDSVVMQ